MEKIAHGSQKPLAKERKPNWRQDEDYYVYEFEAVSRGYGEQGYHDDTHAEYEEPIKLPEHENDVIR